MNLFETEEATTNDWFDVCPNAEDIIFDERKVKLFDGMRKWLYDYDRVAAIPVLENIQASHSFMLDVMNATCPNDPVVLFAGRELLQKENHGIMFSMLALSKNGSERTTIKFPDKAPKAVPNRLLAVFGLRPSEIQWFSKITAREENVRAVSSLLLDADWEHFIHNKPTVSKKVAKEPTASRFFEQWGSN